MRKIMNLMFLILMMLSGITGQQAFAQNVADSLDIVEVPANPTAMQLEEQEAEARAEAECLDSEDTDICDRRFRQIAQWAGESHTGGRVAPEDQSLQDVYDRLRWLGARSQGFAEALDCFIENRGSTPEREEIRDDLREQIEANTLRLDELESRMSAIEDSNRDLTRRLYVVEQWRDRVDQWRIDFEGRNGLQKVRFAGGVVIGMDMGQPIEGGPAAADGTPNLIRGPSTPFYGVQMVPGYWGFKHFAVDLLFTASWTSDRLSKGFSWSAGIRPVYSGPKGFEVGGMAAVGQTLYGIRDDVAGASASMMPELKLGGVVGYRAGAVYVAVEGYTRQGQLQNYHSGNAAKARFGGVLLTVGAAVR